MAVPNVIYNVNVTSKFELFLNDDLCEAEPEELVKKISEDRKKKDLAIKEAKKQKQSEVKKVAQTKPTAVSMEIELGKKDEKSNIEKPPRFQKTEGRLPVKPKNVVEAEEDREEEGGRGGKPKKQAYSGNQGGERRGRGREFDRHSGSDKTGVKSVERKEGSGSYNWGTVRDIVDLTQEPTVSAEAVEQQAVGEEGNLGTSAEDDTTMADKREPEKQMMTMSEWKALHSTESAVLSSRCPPSRPANNGENVFTGMNAYQKRNVQASSEFDGDVVAVDTDDDTDSKGRRQVKVNIEFSGRGRRGHGLAAGFSNSRSSAKKDSRDVAVTLNLDEEEFPTLS